MSRDVDWALWLNKLVFCHGCGRFGMPQQGMKPPRGWKLLYQPHPEGRPGLYVCSTECEEKIKEAMKEGPITDPLEMRPPPMPHELQEQVSQLVRGVAEEERAQQQMEALKRLQGAVDTALLAAMEANEGKPLTKREAIDVAANAIIDTHCNIGMAVTANVEIDDDGIATAEVVVIGKRDPRHLAGNIEDHPGMMDVAREFFGKFAGIFGKKSDEPKLDEPIPFSRTDQPVEPVPWPWEMPLKLMPPPEPEPEEEQHETEMEFVTLKKRDTKGVVIDVNFRPSYMEEGDDGEEDGADGGRAGRRRREAEGAHDAEARDAHRADPPQDAPGNLGAASEAEGQAEPSRDG